MPTRGLPDYTTGTVTVTNNSRTVTGSGTGWTTTLNGVTETTIGAGDMLIVSTGRPIMVESVESSGSLTLTEVWPNATAAGTAYKIRRYVALPTGTVLQAVQALEAKGADTNPLTSWTLDGGTTRLKLRQAAGGQAALSVGTTGAADGSLLDAMLITNAGAVSFPLLSVSGRSFVPTASTVPANGLFLPATNAVGLASNTTERIRITSAGDVGVGVVTPTQKLDVAGIVGIQGLIFTTTDNHYISSNGANEVGVRLNNGATATAYLSIQAIGGIPGLNAQGGTIMFGTGGTSRTVIDSAATKPSADNAYTLGGSGARWSAVWSATGTIQTSDERTKCEILDSDLGLEFINALRPVSYLNRVGGVEVSTEQNGTKKVQIGIASNGNPIFEDRPLWKTVETPRPGTRRHYGLVSQDVRNALLSFGVDNFGGWVLADKDDPESTQALRYESFIAPMIKAIQALSSRVTALEQQ